MSTRTFVIARKQLLEHKRSTRRARRREAYALDARAMRAKAEDIAWRELFGPLLAELLNKKRDIYRTRRSYKLMCLIFGWERRPPVESKRRRLTARAKAGNPGREFSVL